MDYFTQKQIQLLPKEPSSMAEAIFSSRPQSSHSTRTNFSNTSTTSLASALTTSATITVPKWNIHKPQYDAKGQTLDAMARNYPAPDEQLSLDELLALPPLPRTFRYEIHKEDDEGPRKRKEKSEYEAKRKRKEDLEAAKKELRTLAIGLK